MEDFQDGAEGDHGGDCSPLPPRHAEEFSIGRTQLFQLDGHGFTIGRMTLLARRIEERLLEELSDSPVVFVHGPRQCGKTTLVQQVGGRLDYHYLTFDDEVVLAAARHDPRGFVADLPERVILDEIQRVPELFTTLKLEVDRQRTPGRFLLTGSSHVMLAPRLSDSLAGRLSLLRLHPFAQCEIEGGNPDLLDRLQSDDFPMERATRQGSALAERVAAGGFPAALARPRARRRAAWYRAYLETLVQRDVRDLSRIQSLEALPRLLELAAGQTAHLVNVSELAAPFQVSRPTIRSYLTLLERVFLLEELPPWHATRLRRLVKTPKLHMGDTGLACTLLGLDARSLWNDRPLFGQLLETFVLQELRRLASWSETDFRFYHYRDKDKQEVDIVLEFSPGKVAGVEVKAASTVVPRDFRGLTRLRDALGERFTAGIVIYDGEATVSFGERLTAVPVTRLWETAERAREKPRNSGLGLVMADREGFEPSNRG